MKKQIAFSIIILFTAFTKSLSQGCSDAGFCTIGSLAPSTSIDSTFKHLAKLSFSYGIGEQSTTQIQVIPELEFSFLKNNTLQIKAPYISVNGNLGNNSGIGDVVLSISQKLISKENSNLTVTFGTKLPTGTTDKKKTTFLCQCPIKPDLALPI